ncbi:MAG: DUF998 domain-containing protein [Candidatus Micrarchaeota archaeon]|nr:DUF998 domain-containing protein [Candidatus Micrarchaeota archaeon]
MKTDGGNRRRAGWLLALGAAQFLIALVLAESIYPGYSVSANFISDLGVGPAAGVFNGSVMLLGLMVLLGAYFGWKEFREPFFAAALALSGLGALGVGLFPEGSGLHLPASFAVFFFGALAALLAYRLRMSRAEAALSALAGAASLLALALFASRITLGIGVGGMERMVAYPILIWAVGIGGRWMGKKEG